MANKEEWLAAASRVLELLDSTPKIVGSRTLEPEAIDDLNGLIRFFTLALDAVPSEGASTDPERVLAYQLALSGFYTLWGRHPAPKRVWGLLAQYRYMVRKMELCKKICGDKKNRVELASFLRALTAQSESAPAA